MATDIGTIGNKLTRYTPVPGRVHPQEGSIQHLATGIYERGAKGQPVLVGVTDEECRKRQHTLVKGRSKLATASSSSRTERFVVTHGDIDRSIDAGPLVRGPLVTTGEVQPNSVAWQGARGLRRAKRAMRAR